jgi:hypothetical protein
MVHFKYKMTKSLLTCVHVVIKKFKFEQNSKKFEQNSNKIRTKFEQNSNKIRTKFEQTLERLSMIVSAAITEGNVFLLGAK